MASSFARSAVAFSVLLTLAAAPGWAGGKSHIAVPPAQILNLRGGAAANNTPTPLELDLGGPNFTVPAGYVFVATDVQVHRSSGVLDGNQQFLVYLNFDDAGQRYLFVHFTGANPYTASLTTGFVAPAGATPTVVNLSGSDGGVIIGVQGYLLKATALPANTAPF
jgi:hypothetical protein